MVDVACCSSLVVERSRSWTVVEGTERPLVESVVEAAVADVAGVRERTHRLNQPMDRTMEPKPNTVHLAQNR